MNRDTIFTAIHVLIGLLSLAVIWVGYVNHFDTWIFTISFALLQLIVGSINVNLD